MSWTKEYRGTTLKAYRTEWERYKWEWRIKLGPRFSALATETIAKIFDLRVRVELVNRSRGTCDGWRITLPYSGCSLGMVLHEIAHAYDRQKYHSSGHTGTFVNSRGVVFHHSRVRIKELLLKVKAQIDLEAIEARANAERLAKREMAQAERKQNLRQIKDSRGYRIAKAEARIKRLESKAKRLQTMLRTARRSLSALRRYEAKAKEVSHATAHVPQV